MIYPFARDSREAGTIISNFADKLADAHGRSQQLRRHGPTPALVRGSKASGCHTTASLCASEWGKERGLRCQMDRASALAPPRTLASLTDPGSLNKSPFPR